MIPDLHTPRLLLRQRTLADSDRIQALFPVWEVVQYLAAGFAWPFPPDGVRTHFVESVGPAMEQGTEWHWTLRLRAAPDQVIGTIALYRGEQDANRGYWIGVPWQRQGLMSEAVDEVTRFWFEDLRMPRLRAPKAVANAGSRRLSERGGMRVVKQGEKQFIGGLLPYEVWEITREQWLARTQNGGAPKNAAAGAA